MSVKYETTGEKELLQAQNNYNVGSLKNLFLSDNLATIYEMYFFLREGKCVFYLCSIFFLLLENIFNASIQVHFC